MNTGLSAAEGSRRLSQTTAPQQAPSNKQRKVEPRKAASQEPTAPVRHSKPQTLFVNSDTQVEALLADLQQFSVSPANHHVTLITSPEDLEQDGLRRRITVNDDGSAHRRPGFLLESPDNSKVTLVIDFRQFEPSRFSSLNSLFDSPPTLDGRELGGHVQIISLVTQDLFPCHDRETRKAGQDFSARMAQGCSTGSALGQQMHGWSGEVGPIQALLKEKVPEYSSPSERPIYTMDLSSGDWQEVLFGCADIDERGRQYYRRGLLAEVESGETLVLKGAPWQDAGFRHTLYTIVTSGQYYANGEYHTLPENIIWQRQPVTAGDIEQRKDCIQWTSQPTPNPAIINGDNLDLLLCKNRFSEHGTLLRHNSFPEYLSGCSGIRITSPLTTRQWTRLLGAVRATGLTSVPVYLDTPELQPSPFQGPEPEMGDDHGFFQPAPPMHSEQVTLIKGDDSALRYGSAQAAESMDTGKPCDSDQVLNIVVTPDLSLTRLLAHLRLVSLTQARFERQEQSIVSALKTGKIVRIRGLESNPTLARQLESLLASPPMLMINGQPETFENCHIEVYWPGNVTPESAIWQAALEATAQQPEMSTQALKTWLQNRYGLDDTGIVDCIDQLSQLINPHVPTNQQLSLNCDLLSKLVIQAQSERQQTGEQQLSIAHWRKAINSVLLKSYRNDRELYSFCKLAVRGTLLPDEDDNWVDPVALVQWLKQHPNPDIATVQQHFWQLTRCLGCPAINRLPGEIGPGQSLVIPADCEPFQLLARQLVIAAGQPLPQPLLTEVECQALLARLGVQPQGQDDTLFFPRNLGTEKQVQDLCYELGLRCSQKQLRTISSFVELVRTSQQLNREKERRLRNHLLSYFPRESVESTAKLLLDPDNPKHWQHWYSRRKARLKAKVEQHPVTLVTGEPGAGKSFMAVEVAKTLQGDGPVQVISCGPQTRLRDLMVKETLVRSPETGEAEVIQAAGLLRQWADKRASKEQPAVIVIDEANLCDPAVWNGLKGLYEPEPYITDQHGHSIPITEHHHIIMTGNPLSMTGRRLNPLLKDRAPELFFRPLNDPFIASQIVRPALETVLTQLQQQGLSVDIAATQTKLNSTVMALFNQYKRLIPDHEFSPRDLTDFNSRLLSYVNSACAAGLDKQTWQQLDHALAGLVWQSMADSLGGLVNTGIRWQLQALEAWYRVTFGLEPGLTKPHRNKFEAFFDRWLIEHRKEGDDFNLDNQSVRDLARVVWLELDRLESYSTDIPRHFKGRCATVIEGPAGRGKDDLVQRLIHEWNRQQREAGKTITPMRAITLDPNHPDPFYKTLTQTSSQGEIMVGSEMNLVQSQYHEGQMNDLLTGGSTPGFHLFATINPATFVGRHRFSNALNSRCNQVLIGDYDRPDLEDIAGTLFPCHPDLAKRVAEWHWQLKRVLRSRSIPQSPTVGDMKRLAQLWSASLADSFEPDSSEQQSTAMEVDSIQPERDDPQRLKQQFEATYSFYFQFLSSGDNLPLSLDDLEKAASQPLPALQNRTRNLNQWTEWLHRQLPTQLTCPVSVIAGPESSYDHASGVLTLAQTLLAGDPTTQNKQIQQEIVRLFMQERWQRHLPLQSPYEHDILFSAVYHSWQQTTAAAWFAKQPEWAELAGKVFPLSEEERATLTLANNDAYLRALQQLARREPSAHSLAAFEHAFCSESAQLTSQLGQADPTVQAGMEKQRVIEKQFAQIDEKMSSIELDELPSSPAREVEPYTSPRAGVIEVDRYFYKTPLVSIRQNICNATVQDGHIGLETVPMGTRGYEVVIPARQVPKHMPQNEDSGAFPLSISWGHERQWQPIYGIAPQQKLFALEVEPPVELEVIRDRATHLHYLRSKIKPVVAPGGRNSYLVKVGLRKLEFAKSDAIVGESDTVFHAESLTELLRSGFEHDQEFQWLRDLRGQAIWISIPKLRDYFRSFSTPEQLVDSQGRPTVTEFLRQLKLKYGSCNHRAVGFQAMATWLGIPARIIISSNYTHVEASLNNGYSWRTYDLGNDICPGQIIWEMPTQFIRTEAGVTVNDRARQAILAMGRESRQKLADILGIDDQQLGFWISNGGGTPLPQEVDRSCCSCSQDYGVASALVEGLLKSANTDNKELNGELLDLAILLLPSVGDSVLDEGYDDLNIISLHLIDYVVPKIVGLSDPGDHSVRSFCWVLTELAEKATSDQQTFDFKLMLSVILQKIKEDSERASRYLGHAVLQLVAFILLDNDWLQPDEQLSWLHTLAGLATYGERAVAKLEGWYGSLNQKLDCAQVDLQKTPYGTAELKLAEALMPTELTQLGRSRSLESKLIARGGVTHVYGWEATQQLNSDRLIKQQPCFEKGAESVTLPPVVIATLVQWGKLEVHDGSLKRLYIPVDRKTGIVDRERFGHCYYLTNRSQQWTALNHIVLNKWRRIFGFPLPSALLKENLSEDVFCHNLAYQRQDEDTKKQIYEAVKQFRQQHVLPLFAFESSTIPLIDIIRIAFSEYIYKVANVGKGNVKVLSAVSYWREKKLFRSGYLQPVTPKQWRDNFATRSAAAPDGGKYIKPELLLRHRRFDQAALITEQELLCYWREFVDSLGDLSALKRSCVTLKERALEDLHRDGD